MSRETSCSDALPGDGAGVGGPGGGDGGAGGGTYTQRQSERQTDTATRRETEGGREGGTEGEAHRRKSWPGAKAAVMLLHNDPTVKNICGVAVCDLYTQPENE